MASKEHLRILKQGVEVWNRWRAEVPDVRPCLNGADLRGKDFSMQDPVSLEHPRAGKFLRNIYRQRYYAASELGVNFHGVELNGARLNEANLFRANLAGAKLHRTKLTGATLREAVLVESDLSDATVEEADLRKAKLGSALLQRANLRYANLTGANLSRANLTGAVLIWADLRKVTANHSILIDADLSFANLTKAVLWGAKLRGAHLTQSGLVFTNLSEADMTGCNVFGVSAWGVGLRGTNQSNLVITRSGQPKITVDNLEVAQFTYLLLKNEKIRDAIDTIGNKGVLILGRFTEERKPVLDAIRVRLRELDFVPMMFDFERPTQRDFSETIKTLAGLSRFIIVDITNPRSSPLELQAIMPDYMVPFVPIIHEGEKPFAMFRDLKQKYGEWVLDVLEYDSADNLLQVMDEAVVKPARDKADQLVLKKAEAIRNRHVRDYQ
jgi:uncharacterized protein YjbI with pentapeptide repeats